MLAKSENPQQVRDLAPLDVVVLIETPLGALAVTDLARMDNAVALMWGRSAARGQGVRAFGARLGVSRHQGSRRATRGDSRRGGGGFDVKVAIHSAQVAVIREGYAPTAKQVEWARHVLAAARDARGVLQFEGIMVDAPVLRRAERIVALAPHPGD